MAIISTRSKSLAIKAFDGTNGWADGTSDTLTGFAELGYTLPVDITWINRPVGTAADGGQVFVLPRSAEATVALPPPGSNNGGNGWIVREC